MSKSDLPVRRANNIRRILVAMIDGFEICPRRMHHLDSVSLALFARMAELHESICLLASKGRRRDAVILGRTLCEAAITLYWLTNDQQSDQRVNRYVKFGGQVILENIVRVEKHFGYKHLPRDKAEIELLREAKILFREHRSRWNDVAIARMAAEADTYNKDKEGKAPNIEAQYEIFYFWFSLLAHPCIEAIQNFLPRWGMPFKCSRSKLYESIPEQDVVFLSTCWLYSIALRIQTVLKLRREDELRKVWAKIKAK
ncbi:MAG TPA: DUF5677 domain-containing protein [Terriglobia bacterium]|nr:DUF5677 domain-containing protein [Terriglobia bacterium]